MENTYVVHAERRRGRQRTRILYWFRTPPGVKIGRAALDDDAMRRIEQQNPDIEFDWPRIMKGGGSPSTEPRPPVDIRRGRQQDSRRDAQPGRQPQPSPPKSTDAPPRLPPSPARVDAEDAAPLPDAVPADEGAPPIGAGAATAAHARLGAEGVARLRARYAEIRDRIAERVTDPARKDELAATVERLNPDTWKTPDEVTAGLEQYEVVLASVREVVGRRRRKRRRGGRPDHGAPGAGQEAAAGTRDEGADDASGGEDGEAPGLGDGNDPGQDDSGGV